jgi:hypothetical protein
MPTDTDTATEADTREIPDTLDTAPRRRRRIALSAPVPGALPATVRRHRQRHAGRSDDRGQATSEYALVILVAAGIAVGVIAWAGDTSAFTDLFDTVVDHLTSDL